MWKCTYAKTECPVSPVSTPRRSEKWKTSTRPHLCNRSRVATARSLADSGHRRPQNSKLISQCKFNVRFARTPLPTGGHAVNSPTLPQMLHSGTVQTLEFLARYKHKLLHLWARICKTEAAGRKFDNANIQYMIYYMLGESTFITLRPESFR